MSNILKIAGAGVSAAAEETDENFNQTVLLLHGDGSDGAQNNTFLDSSSNGFTITRNPTSGPNAPTQGTFSPFSAPDGRWSNYFDGNDYLSIADSTDFDLDGDFTVQCWVNPSNLPTAFQTGTPRYGRIFSFGTYNAANSLGLEINSNDASNVNRLGVWYNGSQYFTTANNDLSVGTWTHVAVVRSGTTITVYRDGTSVITITGASASVARSQPFYIATLQGFEADSNAFWNGYIANFSILKGTAIDFSSTGVPTAPLSTSTTNQKLLTCYGNRFADFNTATTAKTITVNGNPKVTPFSPFAPTAAYSPSVNGGSGYFDGSGDWLGVGSSSNNITLSGDFCIEAWIYRNANTDQTIWGNYQASPNRGWSFRGFTSNNLYLYFQVDSGSEIVYTTASGSAPIGQWNHVVWCRSGTNTSVFINGTRADNRTLSGTSTGSGGLACGALSTIRTDINPNGYFANARVVTGSSVYDPSSTTITVPTAPLTAITGTQALLNFTNAGIFDNTGKNNLETVGNAQIDTTTKKYGTGSMEFDGTGDWLVLPSNNDFNFGSGNWTIEAWVYFTGTPGISDSSYAIASKWDGSATNEKSFLLRLTSSTGTKAQILCSVDGSTNLIATGSTSLSSGTWYHIAAVQNAGTVTLYVNGTSDATVAVSSVHTNNQRVYVGATLSAAGSPVQPLTGLIDDLRITKGVARYTTTFTPPTKAFPDL